MNLHNLKPAERATKSSKRIGRGQGSGKGGTSTKGHKGAQSRSGYSRKLGFEGGQMPIYRLLPKRGFKNINRVEYNAINLDTLQKLAEKLSVTEITTKTLIENGLAKKKDLVKILGKGELTAKLKVSAHAFSVSAKEAIEKIGGTATIIGNSAEVVGEEKTISKSEIMAKPILKTEPEPTVEPEPKAASVTEEETEEV
jgi:large subunit ribosomal protein L15